MEAFALRQPRRFAARASLVAIVAVAVALAAFGAALIPGTLGADAREAGLGRRALAQGGLHDRRSRRR